MVSLAGSVLFPLTMHSRTTGRRLFVGSSPNDQRMSVCGCMASSQNLRAADGFAGSKINVNLAFM